MGASQNFYVSRVESRFEILHMKGRERHFQPSRLQLGQADPVRRTVNISRWMENEDETNGHDIALVALPSSRFERDSQWALETAA